MYCAPAISQPRALLYPDTTGIDVSEVPLEFLTAHAAALARLCDRARGARWNISDELMRDAAYHAALSARVVDRVGLDSFIDALHAEDLALALACQTGSSAAWEHFITSLRPALYAAARAIAGDDVRGRELADSIWAEMYGLEVRDGRRRSILTYYHGRSSILTWVRAVLAQRHIDYLRTQARIEPLSDRHDQTPANDGADQFDPPDPNRARYVAMLGRALDAALKSLEPRDRMRMAYYYRHDLSLKQIGRIMDEHESTVSRQLSRTRGYLKSEIDRALRDGELSQEQIGLCYDFAASDLQIDLSRALPDIDVQISGRDSFKERGSVIVEGRRPK